MLTALKTLLNNQPEGKLSVLSVTPAASSPSYQDSTTFFPLNEDKETTEVTEEVKELFDFETFHKNMNKQKAKCFQVRKIVQTIQFR